MSKRVLELVSDRDLRARMGQAAQETVEAKFDSEDKGRGAGRVVRNHANNPPLAGRIGEQRHRRKEFNRD
jgi:hypothetical protein